MTHSFTAFSSLRLTAGAWLLRLSALALAWVLLLGAGAVWADPPTRAGRIAEVAGSAWIFDPDTKSWNRLMRNQTVGQGDQVRTDARSRATIRVGSSTVWLDEESDLLVQQLDDGALKLSLLAGDVALRLRTAQAALETRIQTREGAVSPEMEGLFRIDQLDRGTRVAALQGRAQFDSDPGGPVQRGWLREGEQSEFWLAETPRIQQQRLSRDNFSTWFVAQDRAENGLFDTGETYVSPEMTGAEDLNRHGNWETATEYGNVWYPSRVSADWAPYRDGSWVWTRHWGWSWVDNAPWGFAPFHYGRWVQLRGRWGWAPGRFEPRPTYAPALVAWSGGSGVSVAIGVGGVRNPPRAGWVPLPPRQVYAPIHVHTPQYVERFRWDRDVSPRHSPAPQQRGDTGPAAPPRAYAAPVAAYPPIQQGGYVQPDERAWNGGNRGGDRRYPHPVNTTPSNMPQVALPQANPLPANNAQFNTYPSNPRAPESREMEIERDRGRERDRDREVGRGDRAGPAVPVQRPPAPQFQVPTPQAEQPRQYQVPMFNRVERPASPAPQQQPAQPQYQPQPQQAMQPAPNPAQVAPAARPQKPVDDELTPARRKTNERATENYR